MRDAWEGWEGQNQKVGERMAGALEGDPEPIEVHAGGVGLRRL